ncbi:MAG: bifunctional enoyl-CoA hydratase/phosphate acetyltransferase [Acidithiobacillus sp.]|nr:bifunctional enoyl-CoA hydratase/phosphate acetyltransferase [Acidithiobacillus sp.]
MSYSHFDQLLNAAKGMPPISMAVIDAAEEHVLRGACDAHIQGLIRPIFVGDPDRIRQMLSTFGSSYAGCAEAEIVAAASDEEAATLGVELVVQQKAQALMKGHLHSDTFLHPILAKLRTRQRLSHVFLAELPDYPKLLSITDAAINIAPDLPTKAAILRNAAQLSRTLGVQNPKVAVLSAVEVVNPAIPSTVDAACLAKMADRGQLEQVIVDGPLAFDNAISREAAKIKGIHSEVAGDADILVVPDLVSGNILAKDLEYLANASLAGIVLGGQVPIILNSRADPARARLVSAALAVLLHAATGNAA